VSYNLRFPGQYYDAETGLNQNVQRDFDPFGRRTMRAAAREHPDRAPCAGARHCNAGSMISEWIADAIRIARSKRGGSVEITVAAGVPRM